MYINKTLLELLMLNYPDDNQSVEIPNSVCPIWNNDFLNAKIVRERKYLDSNARDRSIQRIWLWQGHTDNHFDSVYIESTNGFADEFLLYACGLQLHPWVCSAVAQL